MQFRVARHTEDLSKIIKFYTEVLQLEIIGNFIAHDGYDGVFIGKHDHSWHLEFTISTTKPKHQFDDDDALIFYPNSQLEFNTIKERITNDNIQIVVSPNPYWNKNAIVIRDPDGYTIIISPQRIQ